MNRKEFSTYIKIEVYRGAKGIFQKYWNKYFNPSTNAVYLVRKMLFLGTKKSKLSRFKSILLQQKLIRKYSIHISIHSQIGLGLRIPHPMCIVVGDKVVIGKNFTIYQMTTIGGARTGDCAKSNQPVIGNDVIVFCGSYVLGKVNVCSGSIIAANSTLLQSTEKKGIYAGNPAILKKEIKNNETL